MKVEKRDHMKDEISALIDDELDKTNDTEMDASIGEQIKTQETEANIWAQRKAKFEKDKEEYQKIVNKYQNLTGEDLVRMQEEAMRIANQENK